MLLFVEVKKGVRQDTVTKKVNETLALNTKVLGVVVAQHVDTLTRNGYRTLVYNVNLNYLFADKIAPVIAYALDGLHTGVGFDLKLYVRTKGVQNEDACKAVMGYCDAKNRGNASPVDRFLCCKSSSKNGVVTLSIVIKNVSDELYKHKNSLIGDLSRLDGVDTVFIN